jgi:hypothetical protein
MAACAHSRLALRTLLKLRRCAEGLTARPFLPGYVPQENHNLIFKEANHGTNQCSGTGPAARPRG